MKGYVINLDRSNDRLQSFNARAAEVGLVFERFPAVDGQTLDEELLNRLGRLSRQWSPLTKAEIATFLSHRGVWQIISERDDKWALVVEDDVVFASDSANALDAMGWIPQSINLVKVETMFTRIELSAQVLGRRGGYKLRLLKENHNGTAGYLLSKEGACFLLDWSRERCEPVDRLMFHPSQLAGSGFLIAQLTPALCVQDFHFLSKQEQEAAISTIGPVRNRRTLGVRDMRLRRRFWRMIVRSVRDIRRFCLRALGISVFERVEMPSPHSRGGSKPLSH